MPFEYEIIKATETDAEEILRLQYTAYQSEAAIYNNYSIQPLTQTLEQVKEEFNGSTVLKAVSGGKIIGSVRATVQSDASIYIGKLMVLPAYQNRGIGKRLLQAIENEFIEKRYWLTTGDKSENNLELYEKQGYTRFKTEEVEPGLSFVYLEKRIKIALSPKIKRIFCLFCFSATSRKAILTNTLSAGICLLCMTET